LVTASPVITRSRAPAGRNSYPENGLVKPPRRDTKALSPAGMFGKKAPLRLAAQTRRLHAQLDKTRTEERAPVWDSEFTIKAAVLAASVDAVLVARHLQKLGAHLVTTRPVEEIAWRQEAAGEKKSMRGGGGGCRSR
jgi:hypothetical protein